MKTNRTWMAGVLAVTLGAPAMVLAQSATSDGTYDEVVRRPVYETRYEPREHTTYEPVSETRWRSQSENRWEPVTRTETVLVDLGRWETVWIPKLSDWDRVWVPRLVEREKTYTEYEKRSVQKQVPYEVTRHVPVTSIRYEPVVTRRVVEERIVRRDPVSGNGLAMRSHSSSPSRSLAPRAPQPPLSRSNTTSGSDWTTASNVDQAFDSLDARVAARTASPIVPPRFARPRPTMPIPSAALVWKSGDTLRR